MELLAEVEVWYALPAIRAKLAAALKKRGIPQKEIAQRLSIAESAVSQYLSGKRGGSELPKSMDAEFDVSAKRIADGDNLVMIHEVMRLSELLKNSRAICAVHKQHSDVPSDCSTCFD